jgi:hypothetical protein
LLCIFKLLSIVWGTIRRKWRKAPLQREVSFTYVTSFCKRLIFQSYSASSVSQNNTYTKGTYFRMLCSGLLQSYFRVMCPQPYQQLLGKGINIVSVFWINRFKKYEWKSIN